VNRHNALARDFRAVKNKVRNCARRNGRTIAVSMLLLQPTAIELPWESAPRSLRDRLENLEYSCSPYGKPSPEGANDAPSGLRDTAWESDHRCAL